MGRLKPFLWAVTLVGVWLVASADVAPEPYDGWTPYFMERSELERSVSYHSGEREMADPGKIWIAGSTIYVVERYKGVHIIDNTNPDAPQRTGFIVAPGCMDVAVKGNFIYLDNAVDLVAFDMTRKLETERLEYYFPEPVSPSGDRYHRDYYNGHHGLQSDMILVGWKKVLKAEERP